MNWNRLTEDAVQTLPARFASSPAVWFKDRIWLVGGSSYNTGQVSSDIWIGAKANPKSPWSWNLAKEHQPNWKAGMGHSVLEFDNKLWVIGGWDGEGNAFKDAHYYDWDNKRWVECKPHSKWHGGCLLGAGVYDYMAKVSRLYLYGGMKEPFSTERFKDTWIVTKKDGSFTWQTIKIDSPKTTGAPIASCLALLEKKFVLVAAFDEGSVFYALTGGTTNGKWTEADQPLAFERTEPFHLLAVAHGRLLVARAQGMIDQTTDKTGQTGLFVYTPSR